MRLPFCPLYVASPRTAEALGAVRWTGLPFDMRSTIIVVSSDGSHWLWPMVAGVRLSDAGKITDPRSSVISNRRRNIQ